MEQEPLPAKLLNYQVASDDSWLTIVKLAAIAGIASGGAGSLFLLIDLALQWEAYTTNWGSHEIFGIIYAPVQGIYCFLYLMLVWSGIGCLSLKPDARKYFTFSVGCLVILGPFSVLISWLPTIQQTEYWQDWKGMASLFTWLLYWLDSWFLPALLWAIMSRAPIRNLFENGRL